jgi:2-keto-4-pentenoate hydratase/2-oxohepta-3-ene-1,7-dioic acid hydratase in catechol pathway
MAINCARFEYQDRIQWGVVRGPAASGGSAAPLALGSRQSTTSDTLLGQRIHPIDGAFATTGEFVQRVTASTAASAAGDGIELAAVKLLSPVTRNQRFICQGANYRQHMIASGVDPDAKTYNMIFTKAPSCIVSADNDVVKPRDVQFLDYEIELGLVIKREIASRVDVSDANLHEFIAGAVIVNDYSARDIQIPQMQFYKGKSFRTFGPVGPYLCLLESKDMPVLRDLKLRLTVNGEVRQSDSTRNLVYAPAETLTELSGVHDLYPGDLLATGTPAGCALSIPSPAVQRIAALLPERMRWNAFMRVQARQSGYLKIGDVVEASIKSDDGMIDLGLQRNRIVSA